jgi:hypothetical protein
MKTYDEWELLTSASTRSLLILLPNTAGPSDPRACAELAWVNDPYICALVEHAIDRAAADPERMAALLILPRDGDLPAAAAVARSECAPFFPFSYAKVLGPLPPACIGLAIVSIATLPFGEHDPNEIVRSQWFPVRRHGARGIRRGRA